MKAKILYCIISLALFNFYYFPAETKASECKQIANEYTIKVIAAPISPFNTDPTEYDLKILEQLTPEQFSSALKNLKKDETSNITISKQCNKLSFNLPFQFLDHKGLAGTVDANYLLNYECNALIRNAKGHFTGRCNYTNDHLGNIQLKDKLDIFGKAVKKK